MRRGASPLDPSELRQRAICAAGLGLATLALAVWTGRAVVTACHGEPGLPLDDGYIHLQFARSFARLRPLEYWPGEPRVGGATSWLWPALLVPGIWAGLSDAGLIRLTWLYGFAVLFGQAYEALTLGRRFLSFPYAVSAALLVLSFSANTWFAVSGMETLLLGYFLLRGVRRAAEYFEGARSTRRAVELVLLAQLACLTRPEGAVLSVAAAVVLGLLPGRRYAALGAVLAALVSPALNHAFTGTTTPTGALIKWMPLNPYLRSELPSAVSKRLELTFGMLLDGRGWAWLFIPEGYSWLAWLGLAGVVAAALRRRARVYAALLLGLALTVGLASLYEAFHANRLRYLWPYTAPWLIGPAALGELCSVALTRLKPRLWPLGLTIPALSIWGLISLLPGAVADVAASAAAVQGQQVSLGRWARSLPKSAVLGINDAGAIAFYGGHKTFDIVGLTTAGEARYWVAGAGSRFEHYERLPPSRLPTHWLVYPHWFSIPRLLGPCLTERVVRKNTVLGGPRMIACLSDYTSLHSGELPSRVPPRRALLDRLDVADLESEAEHDYELGASSADDDIVIDHGAWIDGGRSSRRVERFRLRVQPGGLVIVRLAAARPGNFELALDGRGVGHFAVGASDFEDRELTLPDVAVAGRPQVELRSDVPLTLLHYWSYGPLKAE